MQFSILLSFHISDSKEGDVATVLSSDGHAGVQITGNVQLLAQIEVSHPLVNKKYNLIIEVV